MNPGVEFIVTLGVMLFFFLGSRVIIAMYNRRRGSTRRDNFIIGINQITWILITITGFFGLLVLFNVPVKEFFASVSIIAAAIALLFKDYISNGLNGMIIMFSDMLRINDRVKLGEHKGRIVDITLLSVHLLDDDEDLIYIPNNLVFTSDVVNYTKGEKRQSSVEFQLRPSLLPKLDDYEASILKELGHEIRYIQPGSQRIRVEEVKNNLAEVKFQFKLIHPDKDVEKQLRQKIKRAMLDHLNK